jgi:CRISPR-associated protein Cas2
VYAVVVYDAGPLERKNLRSILKPHLHWIQNSVFAGELTRVTAEDIYDQLERTADDARVTFWLIDREPDIRHVGEQDDEESMFI